MNSPYVNGNSSVKQRCRELIIQEVKERFPTNKLLRILTLPNLNFNFEKTLLRSYEKSQLFLCEKEAPIFNSIACHWAGEPNVKTFYGDMFKVIEEHNLQLNVIWADLCSNINLSLIDNLNKLMVSQNNHPCVLSCTVMMAREWTPILKSRYKFKHLDEMRYQIFPREIIKNTGFRLVRADYYKSELVSSPNSMTSFIFSNR